MAAELTAQEIRGQERYAVPGVSTEHWDAAFHAKFDRWEKDLTAYEEQYRSDHPRPAASRPGAGR